MREGPPWSFRRSDLRDSALEGLDLGSKRRLLVGGLVLVDDALRDGLVELARGSALVLGGLLDVTRGSSLTGLADRGLQGGLDGLVAQPSLLVGLDPLDLGLDVRHEVSLFYFRFPMCPALRGQETQLPRLPAAP